MEISHTTARRLIQFDLDRALSHEDKENLRAHLQSCAGCQRYAASIKEMESIMLPLMRRQWNLSPAPLSTELLQAGKSKIRTGGSLLATRTALIGLMCVVFLFSIWQVTFSRVGTPGLYTAAVPLIPTPSTQATFTKTARSCAELSYTVQENDTLESIAMQFASSKEEIIAANKLNTKALRPGTTIWVPACTFTPTGTINPMTTTYTPSLNPTTSTPGG
jgi:LysM repeat protein